MVVERKEEREIALGYGTGRNRKVKPEFTWLGLHDGHDLIG